MVKKKLYLLDSSALINDLAFSFNAKSSYVMTLECFKELRSLETRLLAENALGQGLLSIRDSCPGSVQQVLGFLEKIGDRRLSKADISLIALALEFKDRNEKAIVVSDDYSIQNALKLLKIPFQPALQGKIRKAKKWNK